MNFSSFHVLRAVFHLIFFFLWMNGASLFLPVEFFGLCVWGGGVFLLSHALTSKNAALKCAAGWNSDLFEQLSLPRQRMGPHDRVK